MTPLFSEAGGPDFHDISQRLKATDLLKDS